MQTIGATRAAGLRYRYELRDLHREGQEFSETDAGLEIHRELEVHDVMRRALHGDLSLGEDGHELARLRGLGCELGIVDSYTLSGVFSQPMAFRIVWTSLQSRDRMITPWLTAPDDMLLGAGEWVRVAHASEDSFPDDTHEANPFEGEEVASNPKLAERDELLAAMRAVLGDTVMLPEVDESELVKIDEDLRSTRDEDMSNSDQDTEASDELESPHVSDTDDEDS